MCCFCILAENVFADSTTASIPIFSSLCVEEQATGFNWISNSWKPANFKASDKLIVRKVDMQAELRLSASQQQQRCKSEQRFDTGQNDLYISACYLILKLGSVAHQYSGEMCAEYFKNGILQEIDCGNMKFLPDGPYVKQSKFADISPTPRNGYKDSLVVAVGSCARIN
ncbi:hypothetical protein GCM10010946_27230 [Undibacterium squillarum]|uniref:Uncharacterized protein n=2 Tax=Undibacterium squillarum TaxID=1131567 RepID=A0ABQ2Y0L6_9BURK|nr:hypothetical protein GCM10010946_27230 [Undibacterium squillarum]